MDTKLKNFSRAPVLKSFAFLLACVCFCAFTLNVTQYIYIEAKYGYQSGDTFLQRSVAPLVETPAFGAEISTVLYKANELITRYGDEKAVTDGSLFTAEKERLRKEMTDAIEKKTQEKYNDYGEYIDTVTYYELYYNYYDVSDYRYANYESEKYQDVLNYIDQTVNQVETYYKARYSTLKSELGKISSLQFALVNRETGFFYSNIPGAQDGAAFAKAIKTQPWHVANTQAEGFYSSGNYRAYYYNTSSLFNYNVYIKDSYYTIANANPYNWLRDSISMDNVDVYLGINPSSLPKQPGSFAPLADSYTSETSRAQDIYYGMWLFGIAFLLMLAYLLLVTGKRPGEKAVHLVWFDRFFCEWSFASLAMILFFSGWIVYDYICYVSAYASPFLLGQQLKILPISALGFLAGSIFLFSLMRHLNNKSLLRNTLPAVLARRIRAQREKKEPKQKLTPQKQMVLCMGIWAVLLLFMTLLYFWALNDGYMEDASILFFGPAFLIMFFAGFWFLYSLGMITQAIESIRRGDMHLTLLPHRIIWPLRKSARDLLHVQEGLQNALDSALRDQKMKTELITNVSHDLKTPLTSIISYVDLLKRCGLQDETAVGYLRVLDEKSARLKTLVEDLMEASKASSGNVELHPVCVNLNELAMQAVGENSDSFLLENIELRLNTAEPPVYLFADSQKTWRITENLLHNAKKYAMPGTRVYMNISTQEGFGVLTIKNISRFPIDIPAQELMQRFVRGDAARSGEGSGLGLSIADSLCTLQGGSFRIGVDADLFTATVRLPLFRQMNTFSSPPLSPSPPFTVPPAPTEISQTAMPIAPLSSPLPSPTAPMDLVPPAQASPVSFSGGNSAQPQNTVQCPQPEWPQPYKP